jgi:hypothetical protein
VLKLNAVQVMNVDTDKTYDIGFPFVAPAGAVVSVEESYPSNAEAFALGYLTY